MLPDPIPELSPMPGFEVREAYNISPGRKLFLHPGSLNGRKGTIEILNAFNHLSEDDVAKIAVLLIGKADPLTDGLIKGKLSEINKKYPQSQIVYKNEFVPDTMLKSCFNQCDVVLIPYTNVEASSGILGHAIAEGKPVIGPKIGLLGELIIDNDLGITLSESSSKPIAKSMKALLNQKIVYKESPSFVNQHSPNEFSGSIIK